jgi:hypothetical protein
MGVSYGKGLKKKCIQLHSKIVRAAGKCAICGEKYYPKLECAHIISRRYKNIVADPRNGVCLCKSCHWRTGIFADEMANLINSKIGWDTYKELKSLAEDKKYKVSWENVYKNLSDIAQGLGL